MALPAALEPACSRNALRRLDATEIEILQFRGAFNLPPKAIQDELVDLFFKWVAPILPIINQTTFRARHRDKENPPSILLLQAIFLTTSQISPSLEIFESCDGEKPGRYAKIFFQRAKALYDAGYEQDPVTIVQSLILMSWFFHGPQGKNLKPLVTITKLLRWYRKWPILLEQTCNYGCTRQRYASKVCVDLRLPHAVQQILNKP